MEFLEGLFARAKANKRRIVLPESLESRTLRAADVILKEGLAEIILLGNKQQIKDQAAGLGFENIDKAIFFDEATSALDNITQAKVCESMEKLNDAKKKYQKKNTQRR